MLTLHAKTPQKLPSKKYKGFTLVELIVVITILVILGTIAFIQLQGFSGSARDSARIENLSNLQKGLTLFQIKSGTYPLPENSVNITASGTSNIIAYQGFAKDQIGSIANLSKGGTQDPLDPTMYTTYSVNTNQTKMQLMTFLEDGSTAVAFVPTTYASTTSDYSKRYPKTLGDTLGILLSTATGTLNQPVQETNTGVDVVLTNTGYLAYITQKKTISGTGTILKVLTANNPKSPIAYALSCKDIIDNGFSIGDGTYYINPTGTGSFQVYCDMTTDSGGWTRVVNIQGNSIFHGDTIGAIGNVSISTDAAKLSDAMINLMNTIGYWRYDCGTLKHSFIKNNLNLWTSLKINSYNWSMDNDKNGTWECVGANRTGYVFSDYVPCPSGHSNYVATAGLLEGGGCYDGNIGGAWGKNGALWVK